MTSRRVLVTGAAGFVGRHFVEHARYQEDVRLFGTYHQRPSEAATLAEVGSEASPIATYYGDLTDADFTRSVVRETQPNQIVHLAAQTSVAESWKDPTATIVTNTLAELTLLEAVVEHAGQARVLIVGSSEEYGPAAGEEAIVAETAPLRPANPYATSKVIQDYLGLQYFLGRGVDVIRARPFNLIGPGQSDRFAIASFARQIAEAEAGRRPPIVEVGNLAPRRDYTDVRDVVRAYWNLLDRGRSGEVYNVGGGGVRSIGEILGLLIHRSRRPVQVRTDPARYRPADSHAPAPDLRRLREDIGWRPTIALEQTVADILDDWRRRIG
jgi:GDP-4-dehydro-6-deoxy-D-mannose reductase